MRPRPADGAAPHDDARHAGGARAGSRLDRARRSLARVDPPPRLCKTRRGDVPHGHRSVPAGGAAARIPTTGQRVEGMRRT